MTNSWIAAIIVTLAVIGTQDVCVGDAASHKIDCQSALDVVNTLKKIDKPVIVNMTAQCVLVY